MKPGPRTIRFASIATLAACVAALAAVGAGAPGRAGAGAPPTVVELFTSQSCYSCPPAEAFLGELAGRDDVIALEFHVDYWDSLVYGSAGKWKDVFSKPAYTRRQQGYNRAIRDKGHVYTPQMVIDGWLETPGGRRGAVLALIRRAGADGRERLRVAVSRARGGGLSVALDGAVAGPASVWLVRFRRAETTRVLAGENKGKTLVNHNVVTGLRRLGAWRGRAAELRAPDVRLAPGEGCAVLVQDDRPGPMLGAAACPSAETES